MVKIRFCIGFGIQIIKEWPGQKNGITAVSVGTVSYIYSSIQPLSVDNQQRAKTINATEVLLCFPNVSSQKAVNKTYVKKLRLDFHIK